MKGGFYDTQGVIRTHSHVLWTDKLTSDFSSDDE